MKKIRAFFNVLEKLGALGKGLGEAHNALGELKGAGVELADALSPNASVRTIEVQAENRRGAQKIDPNGILLPSQLPPPKDGREGGYKVQHDDARSIEKRLAKIIELVQVAKRRADFHQQVAAVLNRKVGSDWAIKEKDAQGEINAIFDKVRSSMRYMMDPRGIDTYRAPRHSMRGLDNGGFAGGDCDDFSSALSAMLETAGYPTKLRIVSIKPDPPGAWSHILVLVGLPARDPKQWFPLDASVNKPAGWYPKERISGHKDFPVPA